MPGQPEERDMSNVVHVVGTGTIGEPLIGLLVDHCEAFGIDEVTFHKRTPLVEERAKVNDLIRRGAVLAVDETRGDEFEALGHKSGLESEEAIRRAKVVIDCTPAGNRNKSATYQNIDGPSGFLAQGSEFGFGKMYARGINDEALVRGEDRFLQVVSCNTHNMSVLVKTLAMDADGSSHLTAGNFLCMRRANDISQDGSFIPSPTVGKHDDATYGTHHARDTHHLFATLGHDLPLWSSAIKLNSQYMHVLYFSIALDREITAAEAVERLAANSRVALTQKKSANQIFSFGRDHGFYGRILSQTVVPVQTIAVRNKHEVVGFCFTPQDGNALLSSIAATLWYLHPGGFEDRIDVLRPYLFREV
jgi:glyceraldehyde-3-phosphate dehydrogenase/erythrose-4-phosphate dehydrogenase